MNYVFVESTKPNKNGHITRILKVERDGSLVEVSNATGKKLRYGLYFDNIESLNYWDYKILDVKKERPTLVGYGRKFAEDLYDYMSER